MTDKAFSMEEFMAGKPTLEEQEYNYALQFWDLVKRHEEADRLLELHKDGGAPAVTEEE